MRRKVLSVHMNGMYHTFARSAVGAMEGFENGQIRFVTSTVPIYKGLF